VDVEGTAASLPLDDVDKIVTAPNGDMEITPIANARVVGSLNRHHLAVNISAHGDMDQLADFFGYLGQVAQRRAAKRAEEEEARRREAERAEEEREAAARAALQEEQKKREKQEAEAQRVVRKEVEGDIIALVESSSTGEVLVLTRQELVVIRPGEPPRHVPRNLVVKVVDGGDGGGLHVVVQGQDHIAVNPEAFDQSTLGQWFGKLEELRVADERAARRVREEAAEEERRLAREEADKAAKRQAEKEAREAAEKEEAEAREREAKANEYQARLDKMRESAVGAVISELHTEDKGLLLSAERIVYGQGSEVRSAARAKIQNMVTLEGGAALGIMIEGDKDPFVVLRVEEFGMEKLGEFFQKMMG